MYLNAYNLNLYLNLIRHLEGGLSDIETYIDFTITHENYEQLEGLTKLYTDVFTSNEVKNYFEFGISRIHKVMNFRQVEFDRSNSYYHLKLIILAPELLWLDQLYEGVVSRILKYYKALFSKIDNIYSNNNLRQKEVCLQLLSSASMEIKKLHEIINVKAEINSEKKRLKEQYLTKIPFQGLFHITHKSNIRSILEKGILSHTNAHGGNYCKVDISNQEINQKRRRFENINSRSIHDYAPLYINPKNPMLKSLCIKQNKREELILIKVNPNVLVENNVLFTDGNAAEECSKFYSNIEDFNKLNWELISDEYYLQKNDGKRVKCSEVLVQDIITIPYIDELLSFREDNFEEILDTFPNHIGIKLRVDEELFY